MPPFAYLVLLALFMFSTGRRFPSLSADETRLRVKAGLPAKLICRGTTLNTSAHIEWERINSTTFSSLSKDNLSYQIFEQKDENSNCIVITSVLIIPRMTREYTGIYRCNLRLAVSPQIKVNLQPYRNKGSFSNKLPIGIQLHNFIATQMDAQPSCVRVTWEMKCNHDYPGEVQLYSTTWNRSADIPSSDFADSDISNANFNWVLQNASSRLCGSFERILCNVNIENYIEFKLCLLINGTITNITSYIFYLSQQEPAAIITGTRRVVVCQGQNISLKYDYQSIPESHETLTISQPRTATKPSSPNGQTLSNENVQNKMYRKQVNLPKGKYMLNFIVENVQVNPPNGLQKAVDLWKTVLKVKDCRK